jgi:hypothetical protein
MFVEAEPAGGAELRAPRLRILLAEEMIHA